jgi:hypothetical protein
LKRESSISGKVTIMEPSAITHCGAMGPFITLCKWAARKAVRWYVVPQFADLRKQLAKAGDELVDLRKELEELKSLQMQAQAFSLNHYRELHGRMDHMASGTDRVRGQAA